jgi:hypothetical protein
MLPPYEQDVPGAQESGEIAQFKRRVAEVSGGLPAREAA